MNPSHSEMVTQQCYCRKRNQKMNSMTRKRLVSSWKQITRPMYMFLRYHKKLMTDSTQFSKFYSSPFSVSQIHVYTCTITLFMGWEIRMMIMSCTCILYAYTDNSKEMRLNLMLYMLQWMYTNVDNMYVQCHTMSCMTVFTK